MTGIGIEYSPCIKCDKTKCSFCELTRYKNSQYERGDAEKSKTDFVEVVRCVGCKFSENRCKDFVWCKIYRCYEYVNGFCYRGERKDGADNA